MSEIFVFAGCNGSGKSTLANRLLSSIQPAPEFVNADIIAAQLNPNDVEAVAITASRLMLNRLKVLAASGADFAFETTLAARTFARFLRDCRHEDYKINLIYVWLESPELAVSRVARRVASGGHNIPQDIIKRRYQRSLKNLVELYLPLADRFQAYDNSHDENSLIAYYSNHNNPITIIQPDIWNQILKT